jgi:hypothetical protein
LEAEIIGGQTTGWSAIGWMDGWIGGWMDGDVTIRQEENMVLHVQVGKKICIGHSDVVQPGAC